MPPEQEKQQAAGSAGPEQMRLPVRHAPPAPPSSAPPAEGLSVPPPPPPPTGSEPTGPSTAPPADAAPAGRSAVDDAFVLGQSGAKHAAPSASRRPRLPLDLRVDRLLRPVAVVAALAVLGAASWWFMATRGPQAVHLTVSFPETGGLAYRVTNSMNSDVDLVTEWEFQSDFEGILTLETKATRDDHVAVRGILDVASLEWNGKPGTSRSSYRTTFRMRPDGNTVRGKDFRTKTPAATAPVIVTGLAPDLPAGEVEPGDVWVDHYTLRSGKRHYPVDTRSELLRLEVHEGTTLAVVQGTKTVHLVSRRTAKSGERGRVTVDQVAWIDPSSGKVVRMTATIVSDTRIWSGKARAKIGGTERFEMRSLA